MDSKLEKQIRLLKTYAVRMTLVWHISGNGLYFTEGFTEGFTEVSQSVVTEGVTDEESEV